MAKIGKECTVCRNTGSFASPVWSAIDAVIEASLPVAPSTSPAATRGDNWVPKLAGLLESEPTFTILLDEDDADYTALANACINRSTIELAILSGPETTAGSEGLHADFYVGMSRGEPLEEGVTVEVTLSIAKTSNDPEWYSVGT